MEKLFRTIFGEIVDLNNESTYAHIETDNVNKLRSLIHQEFGYAYIYMNFWYPPWDRNQERRVGKLMGEYAYGWRDHIDDVMWHKEMLFKIQDEIENMC